MRPAWCSQCECVLTLFMRVGGAWRPPVAAAGKRERRLRCVNTLHLWCFVCDSAECRGARPCRCAGTAVLGLLVRCGCVLVCCIVDDLCSDLRPARCSQCACMLNHCMRVKGAWDSPAGSAGKRRLILRCVSTSRLLSFVCDSTGCGSVHPCRCAGVAVVGLEVRCGSVLVCGAVGGLCSDLRHAWCSQ